MPDKTILAAAGVDVGTEYVKAVVVAEDGHVLGRAVLPARGYFQACAYEVLAAALDDAQVAEADLSAIGATGFAMNSLPRATLTATEASCHAVGAFHHFGRPMTLVDIGGRDARVIHVDEAGHRVDSCGVRRCATGLGNFLMFAARHLDVSSSRLQELAAAAERGVPVTSYCSVFSASEVLERLRDGAGLEEVARGCMDSIAERIVEIGGFRDPLVACGGVVEYFPSVVEAFQELAGMPVHTVPEPIYTGALGAALKVLAMSPSHDAGALKEQIR